MVYTLILQPARQRFTRTEETSIDDAFASFLTQPTSEDVRQKVAGNADLMDIAEKYFPGSRKQAISKIRQYVRHKKLKKR